MSNDFAAIDNRKQYMGNAVMDFWLSLIAVIFWITIIFIIGYVDNYVRSFRKHVGPDKVPDEKLVRMALMSMLPLGLIEWWRTRNDNQSSP